ncbi:hypothetical protein N4G41_00715 [Kosakonia sacchari]|uniref:hypothetical protein n=1 Tax=Kosakonia sacchari TaxID=1158459 RepID=UPI002ACE15A9|nr:hypothetical protein [Kosakonia sacchari]MDZ7320155.1 hypothetical protein [Kosakonia sacchari]
MDKVIGLNDKLDIANNLLNLIFKLGVALGGGVFVLYCWRIGYFPQDVSVGDGLLLILLAVTFGGFYLFFVASLVCLGITLRRVWQELQRLYSFSVNIFNKRTGKNITYTPSAIERMHPELLIFAAFGLFFVIGFGISDIITSATLLLCAWFSALMWRDYQQNAQNIFMLKHREPLTDDELKRLKKLSSNQPFFIAILLILPLVIGGVTGKLLDGTMRLANIRTEAAVVHIKEPYAKYAEEYGLKGEKSNLGTEYSKFSNVSILFNGFGKNVVMENKKPGGVVQFVVPADQVYVVKSK